ncbi:DUF3307 domain-containing protein [Actinoplanes sp. URMC 104]|uniref:DUF3307 domain-containing protein n=1 Tax=Actinoplanes sp. URMC 104 TaxID=3423409 RepID=UPI003F1ACEA4
MSTLGLGGVFAALFAAHQVGDHHVQRDSDAQVKSLPGRDGHRACLSHVASYTATAAVALAGAHLAAGARPRWGRLAAGLTVSAVSHYVIDRREPLRRYAAATGKAGFYQLGVPRPGRDDNPSLGTGAYALDQSAHVGFLFLAALVISKASGPERDRAPRC